MRHRPVTVFLTAVVLFGCLCVDDAEARKIRSSHKISSHASTSGEASDVFTETEGVVFTPDSIDEWLRISEKIRFYGFDKNAGSGIESFFISNSSDSTLKAIGIDILYFDMKGRQLHRRRLDIKCDVAPGETMRHDIKSWDTQKSFYYHRSAKPRRQSTPFDVKIELKKVCLGH